MRSPKTYKIEPQAECHEYRKWTKMQKIIDHLCSDDGATFKELAKIVGTKAENVKYRVLYLLPKAGYGIYSDPNNPEVFFAEVPPYAVNPKRVAKAKAEEEKQAKRDARAAKRSEKEAAKEAKRVAREEKREQVARAKAAVKAKKAKTA